MFSAKTYETIYRYATSHVSTILLNDDEKAVTNLKEKMTEQILQLFLYQFFLLLVKGIVL